MFKVILSILRPVSLNAFRFLLVCVGAWLAAVEPANYWAEARQAANAASGHIPNMDPGVVVILALFIALTILAPVLFVEVTRCAMGGKPLLLPSYLALGAVAACPVGYTFGLATSVSNTVLYLTSSLLLSVFYTARWAWLTHRVRKMGVSR